MKKVRITIPAKAHSQSSVSKQPDKEPPPPPAPDVLGLFAINLEAMREFYRSLPGEGPPKGLYVMMEIMHTDTIRALGDAAKGVKWTPPKTT
jgi:hypothetical protein